MCKQRSQQSLPRALPFGRSALDTLAGVKSDLDFPATHQDCDDRTSWSLLLIVFYFTSLDCNGAFRSCTANPIVARDYPAVGRIKGPVRSFTVKSIDFLNPPAIEPIAA